MHITYERRCVACRQTNLKQNMLRVAKINGELVIDETHKSGGRGAYVCKTKQCLDKVIDKKLLNKSFKTNVTEQIYSKLRGCVE